MRTISLLIFLMLSFDVSGQEFSPFPGLPPDCWETHRAVHDTEDGYLIENYLSISQSLTTISKLDYVSPNGGYSLSWEVSRVQKENPSSYITIDSEKAYLTVLKLENHYGLTGVKWINENLIFFRVYLGRVVFIDVIFNVELEEIIWSQSASDNHNTMRQWVGGCKNYGGCECILKE